MHELWPETGGVRDLLRCIGATSDHIERAALLTRVATELDRAAQEIAAADSAETKRELISGLRAQAGMARFMAELERNHRARQVAKAG